MSGSAATQPPAGAPGSPSNTDDTSPAPLAATQNAANHTGETMTEKSKQQANQVAIPSRTSSHQKQSDAGVVAPPIPAIPSEPPAPRRGSKRSLLSRSRNNSRSSRRSLRGARAVDAAKEPVPPLPQTDGGADKKPRGGFLAFLNCCSPSENKADDPDVAAKKIKIQPAAQRTAKPVENESGDNEKLEGKTPIDEKAQEQSSPEGETELSEKRSNTESRPRLSRELASHDKVAPKSSDIAIISGPASDSQRGQSSTARGEQNPTKTSNATSHDQTTQPDVKPSVATPMAAERAAGNAKAVSVDNQRNGDYDMPDAPPAVPHVDDESLDDAQPAESDDQSQLPPPPPLAKKQEQNATNDIVPPVPEAPEKQTWLLPPIQPRFKGRKCLVLDLDETLVHSSFKILNQADFTIPVEIEGQYHNVYVIKRPGVDAFMKRVGELYEVVVFTASVSKYGDPLLDQLDIHKVVHHRLFRESCYNHQGNYVKVGRDLKETIIIDNSPTSYIFHPQHAVPISSWFSDAHDNELLDLIPVLEDLAGPQVKDVSLVLDVAL